jgi:glycosyltransferase involved in cell wall biosynthesis
LPETAPTLLQLLRERPPGYGGVERVAHELAERYGGITLSLGQHSNGSASGAASVAAADPLSVSYRRLGWPVLRLGRMRVPLPALQPLRTLLAPDRVLLLHLPCPAILVIGWIVHLLQPARGLHVVWHAFLDERRWWFRAYEWLALALARRATTVVSTSPVLLKLLAEARVPTDALVLLPPVLPVALEPALLALEVSPLPLLEVLCIGRLDSYKRFDWVMQAIAAVPGTRLTIVGAGPDREALQRLGDSLGLAVRARLSFLGRVSEQRKQTALAASHVLVLPADTSHEAFGIVQLEAMAGGRTALCIDHPRSGMAWVNGLALPPHHPCRDPSDLIALLQRFKAEPALVHRCGLQARRRYLELFSRDRWQQRCTVLEQRLRLIPRPAQQR